MVVAGTALLWAGFDYLHHEYFGFFRISEHIYLLYMPAGYRLVAIFTFGWLGALGVVIAYMIRLYFFRGFSPETSLVLGALYGLAPFMAFKIWEKVFDIHADLMNISLHNIFWLSVLSATINALFRVAFFASIDLPHGIDQICQLITGNLLGTFFVLYALKMAVELLKTLKAQLIGK